MPGRVFINYRRDDSIATAGRLHDRLSQALGRDRLFMDVDHIPAGVDFVAYLDKQIAEADLVLVVIGPGWAATRDGDGRRRLDNANDFVAVEIASALKRDIRVIPILIDGATMPGEEKLPDQIKALARRNAIEIRNTQFGRDVNALIEQVRAALPTERSWRSPTGFAGVTLAVILGVIAVVSVGRYADEFPSWDDLFRKIPILADLRGCEGAVAEGKCINPGTGEKSWFKNCANCPEMVVVPRGRFTMGSPLGEWGRESTGSENQVNITVIKPFAVSRFAITRAEFATFVKATGHRTEQTCWGFDGNLQWIAVVGRSWSSPGFEQDDRHPVVCMNWGDAKAYVAWLSSITGKKYRLLSDAEREYVARAGKPTPFWWGTSISANQANYNAMFSFAGGPTGEWRRGTVAVDRFGANPWGLYNVHGNVWDWTEDCWNPSNAAGPTDAGVRSTGDCNHGVLRGGAWNDVPSFLRSAARLMGHNVSSSNVGIRVARDLE